MFGSAVTASTSNSNSQSIFSNSSSNAMPASNNVFGVQQQTPQQPQVSHTQQNPFMFQQQHQQQQQQQQQKHLNPFQTMNTGSANNMSQVSQLDSFGSSMQQPSNKPNPGGWGGPVPNPHMNNQQTFPSTLSSNNIFSSQFNSSAAPFNMQASMQQTTQPVYSNNTNYVQQPQQNFANNFPSQQQQTQQLMSNNNAFGNNMPASQNFNSQPSGFTQQPQSQQNFGNFGSSQPAALQQPQKPFGGVQMPGFGQVSQQQQQQSSFGTWGQQQPQQSQVSVWN